MDVDGGDLWAPGISAVTVTHDQARRRVVKRPLGTGIGNSQKSFPVDLWDRGR